MTSDGNPADGDDRTVAGMVGVVTSVLAGSAVGLLAAVAADHSAVAGFVAE